VASGTGQSDGATGADVVIAGGGPTGLMLAASFAWAAGAPDPAAGLREALRTWFGRPDSPRHVTGQATERRPGNPSS
jgi:hypothetical protein